MLSMLETLTQVISKRLSLVMKKVASQQKLMIERQQRILHQDTIAILKQIKCLRGIGPVDYLSTQTNWDSRVAEIISGKPYIDKEDIRIFDVEQPDEEFVWHRDNEDRIIEVLSGDGWQFQPEGSLPVLLKPGIGFTIRKGEYHRLIKGVNNLEIRVTKLL